MGRSPCLSPSGPRRPAWLLGPPSWGSSLFQDSARPIGPPVCQGSPPPPPRQLHEGNTLSTLKCPQPRGPTAQAEATSGLAGGHSQEGLLLHPLTGEALSWANTEGCSGAPGSYLGGDPRGLHRSRPRHKPPRGKQVPCARIAATGQSSACLAASVCSVARLGEWKALLGILRVPAPDAGEGQ